MISLEVLVILVLVAMVSVWFYAGVLSVREHKKRKARGYKIVSIGLSKDSRSVEQFLDDLRDRIINDK